MNKDNGQLKLFAAEPIQYYSYTELSVFSRCPFEYYHRYIVHIPKLPYSSSIAIGRILHKLVLKLLKKQFQQLDQDYIYNLVEKDWDLDLLGGLNESKLWKDKFVKNLKAFFDELRNYGRVVLAEKQFKVAIGDFGIRGRIDFVLRDKDNSYNLFEVKLNQYQDQNDLSDDLQLYFYYLGLRKQYGIQTSRMFYYILEDGMLTSFLFDNATARKRLVEIKEVVCAMQTIAVFEPKASQFCSGCGCRHLCPIY